ncbi:lipase 1-like [Macrosteles quadrilineatus]|uniref:lipase 1-like n=1 Tax=Macrosteles quadrilineatus TaxID=74068 RepID=UPI0023E1A6A1|nr:lipase 1-like [Macrosteles quadrilineatus]XP_054263330.1 lipase 1-like [Macrosteles quadrilineatus]
MISAVLMLVTSLVLTNPAAANSRAMEKMNTMALLNMYGWRSEEHRITTEDGYILPLHRIVSKKSKNKKPPVLLQHGILGASDMWILRGSDKDLPFVLAKAGYDVWLGNVRGNNYCKTHVTMNDTMDDFWDYSFHEMGYYDVPAMIDHILATTGHKQLFYIGHSMGTTMFYTMCVSRPEYNNKIRGMFALAPVAYMSQFPAFLKQMAKYRYQLWEMFIKQGIHQVWPKMPWLSTVEANLCRDGSPLQSVCVEIVFSITGWDYKQFNKSMLPTMIEHLSSTNPRTLAHYAQNVDSGRFQWFDYGPTNNLKVYGNTEAPEYDLSLVTAPVSIHYSTNDNLSSEKDVMKLVKKLPNVIGVFKVPYKMFNHIDYLWGNNAKTILYKDIIHLMNRL